MVEISFYHHQSKRIEETLPRILATSLARGWRVVVQATSPARLEALDRHLWAYEPESFLPHGGARDPSPQTQPIYLTCGDENPNDADVRVFLEGARIAPALSGAGAPKLRAILLFEHENEAEVIDARVQWRELRDAGHTLVYQQQDDNGRWNIKAREPKGKE